MKMEKYFLKQGDLGNGFYLNRDLEINFELGGGRLYPVFSYHVKIRDIDFKGNSFNDSDARKLLVEDIVKMYLNLEEVRKREPLASWAESLRKELSDLLTPKNETEAK